MKRIYCFILCQFCLAVGIHASTIHSQRRVDGHLVVRPLAINAVRIQYIPNGNTVASTLPDWIYVKHDEVEDCNIVVEQDSVSHTLSIKDKQGKEILRGLRQQLYASALSGKPVFEAELAFHSPADEYLYGLGQFQDGYSNVRGLSRRLTQVNTQISIPMLLSNKGYGILWNNYGLTDFNPCSQCVQLLKQDSSGEQETVEVTTTEGNKRETRERHIFQ